MAHVAHGFCIHRSQLQGSTDCSQGMNPISRLAQIQQAKKEKEPEYLLLTERGLPRRREFVMQVGPRAVGGPSVTTPPRGQTGSGRCMLSRGDQVQCPGPVGPAPCRQTLAVLRPYCL